MITEDKKLDIREIVNTLIIKGKQQEAKELVNSSKLEAHVRDTLLGLIHFSEKDFQVAIESFESALKNSVNNAVASGYLGVCEITRKNWKKAEKLLDLALEKIPEDPTFLLNRALVHSEKQEFKKSLEITTKLLKKHSNNVNLYALHVGSLRAEFRFDEAEAAINQAIKHFPQAGDLLKIRADLLSELNPVRALSAYEEIRKKQDLGKATKWNSAFTYLRNKNFIRGFEYYEYGLDPAIGRIGRPQPQVVNELTRIKSLNEIHKNDYIVVSGEQGIGDQVLFASALNELKKFTPNVILVCDRRMIPIFRRSFPWISVHEFGLIMTLKYRDDIRGIIPLGSLMKDLRTTEESFIQNKSIYLQPNNDQVALIKKSFLKHFGKNPVVGISWKGGFWERQQKGKTLRLEDWGPLLKRTDITFLSLQYGDIEKEKELSKKMGWNLKFVEGIDFKADLDSWFSLIAACDLVLSISTAMVHFAGASGKKTYVLLSDSSQPFCWGLTDRKSYIYTDVHLIRKNKGANLQMFFSDVNRIFV